MLSSLLRPKKGRSRVEEQREQHSPFSSHYDGQSSPILERTKRLNARRHATADFTETELDDDITEEEDEDEEIGEEDEDDDNGDDGDGQDDEDGHEDSPLLPIFSAAHLGKPLYKYTLGSCSFNFRCASCL